MSKVLESVETWVEVNDRVMEHDESGSLRSLRSGNRVELFLATDEPTVAFMVNEKSNAFAITQTTDHDKVCYVRPVLVKQGNPDFVGFPDNHMGIIFLRKNGRLEVVKSGILTQSGKHYVVTHPTAWQPQLFRDSSGEVVCPAFSKWESLLKIIVEGFQTYHDEFPSLPEGYTVPEEQPTLPTEPNQGIVEWYEPFHGIGGTGAIKTIKGSVRVSWQEAPPRDGTALRYLTKGEKVAYKSLATPQGKTKFAWEAKQVSLI